MKKRSVNKILLLCLLLIFFVTGCNSQVSPNTEISNNSELVENTEIVDTSREENQELVIDVGIPDEELTLMQKVLFNKAEYNNGLKIEAVEGVYGDENERSVAFQVVDLDHDGENEVCLTYASGDVLIFHEIEGCIYGYEYTWRGMVPLYEDGTFCGSGGASYSEFYGNVSFTKDEFHKETITAVEYLYNPETVVYYGKGGKSSGEEISKEEYDQIMSQYEKIQTDEYDFTVENILKYVK